MKIIQRLKQRIAKRMNKNACVKCDYYHRENGTCQSKKCATMGPGYVSLIDWLFCEPREERSRQERRWRHEM